MSEIIDQSPSPKFHIKTLMRIGYTLNSAVADVIDNSISAGARNIEVHAPPGLDEPIISILDDGCGMDLKELKENMRIGCRDPDEDRHKGDLGRFGSGMKTASFSQARRLTVVSVKKGHAPVAARWDIDKVEASNSWCLEVFEAKELDQLEGLSQDLPKEKGTQIIWSKLTCFAQDSHGPDKDVELAHRLSELKAYIALHFHRFMSGGSKRVFRLNGTEIKPIDPFMTRERGYQEGPSTKIRCKGGHIVIKTHVLPHFKNMEAARLDELGGAEGIAQKQGLYLYREKRLISAGGWLGLAPSSQLGALARVEVDIPSSLDNDWSTDVKKASLQIPSRLKKELRKFLADPIKRSKRVHKYRGKLDIANKFWKICEDENSKSITYQIAAENSLLEALVRKSGIKERRMLIDYLKQLSLSLPVNHIYEKMSERPKDVKQGEVDMADLESLLKKALES